MQCLALLHISTALLHITLLHKTIQCPYCTWPNLAYT